MNEIKNATENINSRIDQAIDIEDRSLEIV